jgi:hypothetical protein
MDDKSLWVDGDGRMDEYRMAVVVVAASNERYVYGTTKKERF